MRHLAFVFLFVVAGPASAGDIEQQCTHEEMIVAESVQHFIESWGKYYDSYRFFGRCSDGVVSEAFTDTATSLLANQWKQLPTFYSFVKRDRAFLDFVLGHIGGIENQKLLNQIAQSSKVDCPAGMKTLCTKINKAAMGALK